MTALIVIVVLIVILALWVVSMYNRLVSQRNLVQEAWSVIDVMLKKRYDLIPNLVETVKGYATHERETLDAVISARSKAQQAQQPAEKEAAEKSLGQAMVNLFAVAEQYPDLKANTNFLQLQNELSNIEGDVEKSRRYYNGTVREFNTSIESFPSNLLANSFGFQKSAFFEIDNAAERTTPNVKF